MGCSSYRDVYANFIEVVKEKAGRTGHIYSSGELLKLKRPEQSDFTLVK